MKKEEFAYLDLVKNIINLGCLKEDRTGVGTRSLFCQKLEFDLTKYNLPILTHRKIKYQNAIEEFLFMWRGETQTKLLEQKGVNIWKGNTSKEFIEKNNLSLEEGDMGPMYGYNLRSFAGFYDQLNYVVEILKTNPNSRRITMTTQDPSKRGQTVLDCCHGVWIQFFYDTNTSTLDLCMVQRSCDIILGFPTNVIFYSLMLYCICAITKLNPGRLIMHLLDVHIYNTHIEKFNSNKIDFYKHVNFNCFPTLSINKELNSIEDVSKLEFEDFIIKDYTHGNFIKYNMAI